MELIRKNTDFDFLGKRRLASIVSVVLILASLGALLTKGLNFGIDFTGGTLIEVAYPGTAELGAFARP